MRERMCCCRPPPGARRTARRRIPSAASRGNARSCRRRVKHAALSAFENGGMRDFDIGALAAIPDEDYDALTPVQWPLRKADGPGHKAAERRFFAEGGFFTPDRKARFIAPEPPALKEATSEAYPLRLNTGRIRDQWHTMTRSGLSPRLAAHLPEPFVEVSPDDAAAFGLSDGGFARVA